MKITQAVIPAAGLGTRFLPYTKSVPKELVPILGTPSIQLVIEEGLKSAISNFIIIANDDKQAIKDQLTHNLILEKMLAERGKNQLLESLNTIINSATFTYVPQPKPLGLGNAVLMAKNVVGNNYCGILLPDDLFISHNSTQTLGQLMHHAIKYNASVVGVQEVSHEKVSSYGIIAPMHQLEDGVFAINNLIEKPSPDAAPSNLAIVGRYVLSPKIFNSLEYIAPGVGGEYQLTDGIKDMLHKGEKVIAYLIKETRHDIGNPLGWLEANIDYALRNPLYAKKIKEFCQNKLSF